MKCYIDSQLAQRNLTIITALTNVSAKLGVQRSDIQPKSRRKHIALARMATMYLLHECHGFTHQQAAWALNCTNHGASIHACKKVTSLMAADASFAATMHSLRTMNAAPSHPSCN